VATHLHNQIIVYRYVDNEKYSTGRELLKVIGYSMLIAVFQKKERTTFVHLLMHCIWTGCCSAIQKILIKARQLVDVKKDDGFAALHLAALNGHLKTAETLIDVVRHSFITGLLTNFV